MQFGKRVRKLRVSRGLTQQAVADRMNVSVSYISKVENSKLNFGDYPSEKFIHKLAVELKGDEDELLLLAAKVPAAIRKRIHEHPNLFLKLAEMDSKALDRMEKAIANECVS
jgi:HTH-type transcriptional regulator, competence development regulator